jgi:ABC-type phosphate transport system permease subunit
MSDLMELEEPQEEHSHEMRDEIRAISDRVRARRIARSRVMIVLCGLALAIAAVPLVLLIIQLISKGAPTISWKFFTTERVASRTRWSAPLL